MGLQAMPAKETKRHDPASSRHRRRGGIRAWRLRAGLGIENSGDAGPQLSPPQAPGNGRVLGLDAAVDGQGSQPYRCQLDASGLAASGCHFWPRARSSVGRALDF